MLFNALFFVLFNLMRPSKTKNITTDITGKDLKDTIFKTANLTDLEKLADKLNTAKTEKDKMIECANFPSTLSYPIPPEEWLICPDYIRHRGYLIQMVDQMFKRMKAYVGNEISSKTLNEIKALYWTFYREKLVFEDITKAVEEKMKEMVDPSKLELLQLAWKYSCRIVYNDDFSRYVKDFFQNDD